MEKSFGPTEEQKQESWSCHGHVVTINVTTSNDEDKQHAEDGSVDRWKSVSLI